MLYIVATPIGNMEDITLRALRILKEADFIIAEDTRHSGLLLKKYNINSHFLSFHSHSNPKQLQKIIDLLKQRKNLTMISDAGTPGISDPGYIIIKNAIENKISITAVPGPSAVINAVVMSGLPCHRFLYLGYLPLKKGRGKMLEDLKKNPYTAVFYEAPHRLIKTLNELKNKIGERQIAVCREMTKMFEEIFRGKISDAIKYFSSKRPRGEFTIVIGADIIEASINQE